MSNLGAAMHVNGELVFLDNPIVQSFYEIQHTCKYISYCSCVFLTPWLLAFRSAKEAETIYYYIKEEKMQDREKFEVLGGYLIQECQALGCNNCACRDAETGVCLIDLQFGVVPAFFTLCETSNQRDEDGKKRACEISTGDWLKFNDCTAEVISVKRYDDRIYIKTRLNAFADIIARSYGADELVKIGAPTHRYKITVAHRCHGDEDIVIKEWSSQDEPDKEFYDVAKIYPPTHCVTLFVDGKADQMVRGLKR